MAIALVGLAAGYATSRAPAASLLEKFQAEYPAAADKLDSVYNQVEIHATEVVYNENSQYYWRNDCNFLRDGNQFRALGTLVESSNPSASMGGASALGGSKDKYFAVAKGSNRDKYAVRDFGSLDDNKFLTKARIEARPIFTTCHMDGIKVREYISFANVSLLSAAKVTFNNQQVLEVRADQVWDGEHRVSTMYFLPDSLALAGWRQTVGTTATVDEKPAQEFQLENTYQGDSPLKLSRIDWREVLNEPTGPRLMARRTYDIDSINFHTVPPSEFTLASLGVAEPIAASNRQRIAWIVAINGILLLLGGALWAIHRKNKSNGSSGLIPS